MWQYAVKGWVLRAPATRLPNVFHRTLSFLGAVIFLVVPGLILLVRGEFVPASTSAAFHSQHELAVNLQSPQKRRIVQLVLRVRSEFARSTWRQRLFS